MPQKIRELEAELRRAGFVWRAGKGSHRVYIHPSGVHVTISGQPGHDAGRYQAREVQQKIEESKRR